MTRTSWFLIGCLLLTAPGCHSLDLDFSSAWEESAPRGKPNHLGVIWKDGVDVQLDPRQGGKEIPGFAGRLIFMRHKPNQHGDSVAVDGTVLIELFDATNPHAPIVARETWTIRPEDLPALLGKDITGWGYAIWLPWNTYDPNIRTLKMVARFTGKDGVTIVSEPNVIKVQPPRHAGLPPQLSVMSTTQPPWMR
jgi:hypothetical protein